MGHERFSRGQLLAQYVAVPSWPLRPCPMYQGETAALEHSASWIARNCAVDPLQSAIAVLWAPRT